MTTEAGTTTGLQAKVTLRRAWFEAHPNQPPPEGRARVDALIAAIEAEAVAATLARIRAAVGAFFGPHRCGPEWGRSHAPECREWDRIEVLDIIENALRPPTRRVVKLIAGVPEAL